MPTYFVINELNEGYSWEDFTFFDLSYEYAQDVHNIPEDCIYSIDVLANEKKVEITLIEDKSIIKEDWYHSLMQYVA